MSLFDFVKEAGAKILESVAGGDADAAVTDHVKKELPDSSAAQVEVHGDTVKISGQAATQAEKEKMILAAGNVHGVAKVDDNISVAGDAAPQSRMYTVKSGDTLSGIAKEMYGNAMEYPKIFEANKPLLKDPNKIYPGQVLRIP